ncbi:MAG: PhzF family phenazine biosynthesis protein [Syntrophales bacterium]|nr:PhzF family phenazine biosynthesis protein [Syntrophales bacterium]
MADTKIPIYQVDAFTTERFRGNPAAVCILDHWLPDEVLQAIAMENNLSETAFLVESTNIYNLRWFTPKAEIDLCGHATLASAFVLFSTLKIRSHTVSFSTRSGILTVELMDNLLFMDFPSRPALPCPLPEDLAAGLGKAPSEVLRSRDYIAVFADEDTILSLEPRMDLLARLDATGIIVTAPGKKVDFVSRFFAPRVGVDEDPVTGSSHSTLIPFWSERLGKKTLHALQLSKRGGELFCEDRGTRVRIGGSAVLYLEGSIHIEENRA